MTRLLSRLVYLAAPTCLLAIPNPSNDFPITKAPQFLSPRQVPNNATICGYRDYDSLPWIAGSGFKCMVDTQYSVFGFCPMDATTACNDIVRACKDSHRCSTGCGGTDVSSTLDCTATDKGYCATNSLVAGPGQTYSRVGCDTFYRSATFLAAKEFSTAPNGVSTSTPSPSRPQSSSVTAESTSLTSTNSQNNAHSASSSNTGAIVGGVIGGLALVSIAGIVFFFLRRRKHLREEDGKESELPAHDAKYAFSTELDAPHSTSEIPARPTSPSELPGSRVER